MSERLDGFISYNFALKDGRSGHGQIGCWFGNKVMTEGILEDSLEAIRLLAVKKVEKDTGAPVRSLTIMGLVPVEYRREQGRADLRFC